MNYVAIAAATLVGMVLGALWYSPVLFANQWMRCIGKTKETLGSPMLPMIGSVFACVLTAVGIAILHELIGVDSLAQALIVGLLLGALIIFPAFLSDSLFCGWGAQLLLIQVDYRFLSVVLMSAVIYIIDT